MKFKTPGQYLSMNSMFGVVSSVRREIEIAIAEVLYDEFPLSSRELIRRQVRKRVDLSLKDAQKGSWEVFLIGTVGGAIGSIVINLVSDIITNSEQWKKFRGDVYSISEKVSKRSEARLARKKKIGPYEAEYKRLKATKKNNGVPALEIDIELHNKRSNEMNFDMEEEVNRLIDELQNKRNK
ncbi:hypothetical protein LRB11_16050 [Ectothiorhodospira haloalkaliphila]|uniref:hypothetical protein n=1 Tax=Ectothiorhodospira haloalkaliphila TaxID=421628 RepID=UPI001EE7A9CF|nr:hypothetical protein [Ectothiorhodospira haloalkaliphila]MCG5526419.1 hypothetical protein [Ectothiorhodospira haloalkaliphila]